MSDAQVHLWKGRTFRIHSIPEEETPHSPLPQHRRQQEHLACSQQHKHYSHPHLESVNIHDSQCQKSALPSHMPVHLSRRIAHVSCTAPLKRKPSLTHADAATSKFWSPPKGRRTQVLWKGYHRMLQRHSESAISSSPKLVQLRSIPTDRPPRPSSSYSHTTTMLQRQ